MKLSGSGYVALVLAAIGLYVGYQLWFNPTRAVQRRLGHVAAVLSVPAAETDLGRVARLADLRGSLAPDVHVRLNDRSVASRDQAVAVLTRWAPPAGAVVEFVDVQVAVDSSTTAHAYLTVEITTPAAGGGAPTIDTREARVSLRRDGRDWLITAAEPNDPTRP